MSIIDTLTIPRNQVVGHALFPLALVPMEKFMLWDDTHAFPKTFRVGLVFRGVVDHDLLYRSFAAAIARHPLLCASIQGSDSAPVWNIGSNCVFEFASRGSFTESPFVTRLDIRKNSGLRFWHTKHAASSELTIEFHHACCDGLGAQKLLRDWLLAYDQLAKDNSELNLPIVDVQRLLGRGDTTRWKSSMETGGENSLSLWRKLELAYRFHVQSPKAFRSIPSTKATELKSDHAAYCQGVIDQDVMQRTESHLRQHSLSLNDFAVGMLAQTLSQWLPDQRLRVMVPVHFRSDRELRTPACNRIGFGFVSFEGLESDDASAWVQVASVQLRAIQRLQLGLDFVDQFSLACKLPWLSRRVLRARRCWSTAILTNLGDMTHRFHRYFAQRQGHLTVGKLDLLSVYGVPPIREQTHLGVGICRMGNQVSISLRAFSTPSEARALLINFTKNWEVQINR